MVGFFMASQWNCIPLSECFREKISKSELSQIPPQKHSEGGRDPAPLAPGSGLVFLPPTQLRGVWATTQDWLKLSLVAKEQKQKGSSLENELYEQSPTKMRNCWDTILNSRRGERQRLFLISRTAPLRSIDRSTSVIERSRRQRGNLIESWKTSKGTVLCSELETVCAWIQKRYEFSYGFQSASPSPSWRVSAVAS